MTQDPPARGTSINRYTAEDVKSFQAFRLSDGRRAGFCWDEKPRCVGRAGEEFGHRLKPKDPEAFKSLSTEMVVRCQHKQQVGHPICGVLLYVAVLSFGGSTVRRGSGERCMLVVELHEKMLDQLGEPMLFLERCALIDIALPGVHFDIGVPREVEDPDAIKRRNAEEAERRAKEANDGKNPPTEPRNEPPTE